MVTITCPWCEADEPLTFAVLEQPEALFTCTDCGTTVAFVDEPEERLELAA